MQFKIWKYTVLIETQDTSGASIEDRVKAIENTIGHSVPGTGMTRVLLEDRVGWCLSIGGMMEPKKFFRATTLSECFDAAEKLIVEIQRELAK